MQTILKVEGMSCSHCENAVNTALTAISAVSNVTVDLQGKTVTVEHQESVSREVLANTIEDQGFDVVG